MFAGFELNSRTNLLLANFDRINFSRMMFVGNSNLIQILAFSSIMIGVSMLPVVGAQTYQRYLMSSLSFSPGALAPFAVADESQCVANCSSTVGCSAVSYSPYQNQCIVNMCGIIQLAANSLWETIIVVASAVVEGCDLPRARFEWMLTDTCGNASSGYLSGVPSLSQVYPGLSALPVSQAPSVYFGRPYSGARTCWNISTPNNIVDYNFTNSFTMFVYYYRKADGDFPFFEYTSSDTTYVGIKFWRSDSKLYYYVGDPSTSSQLKLVCSANCDNKYVYTSNLNSWESVALVYDASSTTVSIYFNESLTAAGTANVGFITNSISGYWNQVTTGCRLNDALARNLTGSVYCVKFFDVALTPQQIQSVAQSCKTARIRLY